MVTLMPASTSNLQQLQKKKTTQNVRRIRDPRSGNERRRERGGDTAANAGERSGDLRTGREVEISRV